MAESSADGDGVLVEFASAFNQLLRDGIYRRRWGRQWDVPDDRRSSCVSGSTRRCDGEAATSMATESTSRARLEEMAEPGGIVISRKVHEEIERKLSLTCDDLGDGRSEYCDTDPGFTASFGKREQTAKSAGLPLPPASLDRRAAFHEHDG